jgi:hypothetical protein
VPKTGGQFAFRANGTKIDTVSTFRKGQSAKHFLQPEHPLWLRAKGTPWYFARGKDYLPPAPSVAAEGVKWHRCKARILYYQALAGFCAEVTPQNNKTPADYKKKSINGKY